MLAKEPRPGRWLDIASEALFHIQSDAFTTAATPLRVLRGWFGDGIVAAYGPTSPAALEVRYERELREGGGVEVARSLVDDVRGSGAHGSALLGDALVLLARRLDEEGQHAAALESLDEALAAKTLDVATRKMIIRLRAASMLRLRRLDDAFAILDVEMETKGVMLGGCRRFGSAPEDPWDAALAEAAAIAVWASSMTPEWVRALGGIAQRAKGAVARTLWTRFERGLVAMVDGSANPGSDLEVVVRQAKQRGLRKTARAAEDLARERGIELVDNVHFG